MRVLFLNPSGEFGGAERVLLDAVAGIQAARPGWRLSIIASAEGSLALRAGAAGIELEVLRMPESVARLGDSGAGGPAGNQVGRAAIINAIGRAVIPAAWYRRKLAAIIRTRAPDIIHTNGFKMHLLGLWAAPAATPVVWHVHDYVGRRPVMARLMRIQADRCAAAITNSRSVADNLRVVCGDRLNLFTVYNAVDLDQFTPEGPVADLDHLAGMPPAPRGTVRVGMVATMARWKGHQVFLRALAALPGEVPVRAYVMGDAVYQTNGSQHSITELKAVAQELCLAGRVGFTGFVANVPAAMRALDIVVHASTEPEPFGLVIAEAMACGRATIISDAGGAAEIAQLTGVPVTHKPGDSAALADRIMDLLRDRPRREHLGRTGRSAAERIFSRSRMASELASIYENLVPTRA